MQITETATTAPRTTQQPAAATPTASKTISSDFETFLKMLTTQLQNQDPLNPLESTDFAVQLATFSGVEQQVRTNDLLAAQIQQMSGSGMAQLAGWVGTEVRTDAPAYFGGAPVTLYPTVARGADEAALVVRDSAGQVVMRAALPLSDEPIAWAGVRPNGSPLPAGTYSFEVESRAGGEFMGTSVPQHYAVVREVRSENGVPQLVTAGGTTIGVNDVIAVRRPDTGLP